MATAPHPPDDHGKKDEHKDEHKKDAHPPEKKKKTLVQTLVMIGLSALAVIVFLYYMGPIVGMGFDGLNGILVAADQGMRRMGNTLLSASDAVTHITFGGLSFGLRIAILIIGLAFTGYITVKILKTLQNP